MSMFRVTKKIMYEYEALIEAEDWEEAEEKARYNPDVGWEDITDYADKEDIEAIEEEV